MPDTVAPLSPDGPPRGDHRERVHPLLSFPAPPSYAGSVLPGDAYSTAPGMAPQFRVLPALPSQRADSRRRCRGFSCGRSGGPVSAALTHAAPPAHAEGSWSTGATVSVHSFHEAAERDHRPHALHRGPGGAVSHPCLRSRPRRVAADAAHLAGVVESPSPAPCMRMPGCGRMRAAHAATPGCAAWALWPRLRWAAPSACPLPVVRSAPCARGAG